MMATINPSLVRQSDLLTYRRRANKHRRRNRQYLKLALNQSIDRKAKCR
jgi:hypothetical protein